MSNTQQQEIGNDTLTEQQQQQSSKQQVTATPMQDKAQGK